MTLTRRQVVEMLEQHGLAPSRALGQNFVVDPNTVRRIARLAAIGPGDAVLEIGAGLGSLTLALAETGADVTAVELDRGVVEVLREVVAGRAVRVVHGDALTLAWDEVLADRACWVLVANLPYNVATPLVLDLLQGVPRIQRMLVMVQREVADRLAARPGSASYGIPSVKVGYWATARVVGRVPPDVFLPRPRVESALVAIARRPEPATAADRDRMFALVQAGFGQRRKMLRRSLGELLTADAFALAGIAPEARAEELSIEDWGRLTDAATTGAGRVVLPVAADDDSGANTSTPTTAEAPMSKDQWATAVRRVDKPWGHEEIFALEEGKYCGKIIYVTAGHALSLQYHEQKEETISIQSGSARLEVGQHEDALETIDLSPGESVHLAPGTRHRLTALTDVVMLEASTTQLDDVVRLEDRYGRQGTSAP